MSEITSIVQLQSVSQFIILAQKFGRTEFVVKIIVESSREWLHMSDLYLHFRTFPGDNVANIHEIHILKFYRMYLHMLAFL